MRSSELPNAKSVHLLLGPVTPVVLLALQAAMITVLPSPIIDGIVIRTRIVLEVFVVTLRKAVIEVVVVFDNDTIPVDMTDCCVEEEEDTVV